MCNAACEQNEEVKLEHWCIIALNIWIPEVITKKRVRKVCMSFAFWTLILNQIGSDKINCALCFDFIYVYLYAVVYLRLSLFIYLYLFYWG